MQIMAKSKETFNKKEREKLRQKKKRDKEVKKEQRKANASEGRSFEDMIAYVDEDGNITSSPPDPGRKRKVRQDDIEISIPRKEKEDPVRKGRVNYFNEEKGYGFILDQETGESIFVHVNGLVDRVEVSDKVTFEVERGQKGLTAVQVKVVKLK